MDLNLTAFIYEDHLSPTGYLPREEKVYASAVWHFARLANIAILKVPEQATAEGDLDQTIHLKQLMTSVATLYGIDDLNRMMAFMDFAKAEAFRCGMPWSDRFSAWIESGGKAYNEVTREPEALNIS